QSGAGEEESIQNKMIDAEALEGDFAEKESGTPEDAGERAGCVTKSAADGAAAVLEGRGLVERGAAIHQDELGIVARLRHASPMKSRMAAMPAAPFSMQAGAFFSVTPPRAITGMGAAISTAERRAASPWPLVTFCAVTFSKTGEKSSSEAPEARRISSGEWQAALTMASRPARS